MLACIGAAQSASPRQLPADVWRDQKAIWTSPFHMKSRDATCWVLFSGATAGLIASDHATAYDHGPTQIRWGNRISRVGAAYTLVPAVAGFYAWGVWKNQARARETGIRGGEALLDALITVEVLKLAARRNRPDAVADRGKFFAGGTSFPSGHSIEGWALASLIAHQYRNRKWVPVTVYGLAGAVSAARFAAQKHYASDIVAGGVMGWFIGRYVGDRSATRWRGSIVPQLVPVWNPSARTYGIALTFGGGGGAVSPAPRAGVAYANPYATGIRGPWRSAFLR